VVVVAVDVADDDVFALAVGGATATVVSVADVAFAANTSS
jgi:hypothetical protein